jgi:fatty acid desaturase
MSAPTRFLESLKETFYQWRYAFYVIGVLWAGLSALTLVYGPWWLFAPYIAMGAAHFYFYEKCCTWKAKP